MEEERRETLVKSFNFLCFLSLMLRTIIVVVRIKWINPCKALGTMIGHSKCIQCVIYNFFFLSCSDLVRLKNRESSSYNADEKNRLSGKTCINHSVYQLITLTMGIARSHVSYFQVKMFFEKANEGKIICLEKRRLQQPESSTFLFSKLTLTSHLPHLQSLRRSVRRPWSPPRIRTSMAPHRR